MLNIIKADLYRIFRGKGIYITLAIFIITLVLNVTTKDDIGIMLTRTPVDVPYETFVDAPHFGEGAMIRIITGKSAPFILATNTDNLIFFLLPFIVFLIAADFTGGTVKNLLSSGVNRVKYYSAKLILIGGTCIALMILNLIVIIVTATIANGFRGNFDFEFIYQIVKMYTPQLFLLFVFGCIGIFLIFTLKNSVALNTIYIAYVVAPMIILSILQTMSERSETFKIFENAPAYDLVINMKTFAYTSGIDQFMLPNLSRTLILGSIYIILCTIGGILLFRKAEIK